MHPAERCLDDDVRLDGTTALVTGATDGIGRETALALGRRGANVAVHGRDRSKAQAVRAALEDTAGAGVGPYLADFTDLDAVRDLADAVAADYDVDVLVNNAGASFGDGELTAAGVERTMQVNHLAPFLLTRRLLPDLRESDGAHGAGTGRVVVVASEAHRGADLDLEAATDVSGYDQFEAYQRSKLANLLFVRALARREADRANPIAANACHPGFVPDSALWRDVSLPVRVGIGVARLLPRRLRPDAMNSEDEGAAPSVYLAASPETADWRGAYVAGCERREPSDLARDDGAAERLWEWSAEAVGSAR